MLSGEAIDGVPGVNEAWTTERAVARYAGALALGIMGVALGWFAYVDAPISDRVMLWIAGAIGAGSLATLAGLGVLALTLRAPAESAGAQRRVHRLLRLALLALAALVLLMAMAMVVTLNLRGTGSDADVEDTATAI
jgi:hypothetical protein